MAFINDVILNITARSQGAGKVNQDLKRVNSSASKVTNTLKSAAKAFAGLFAVQQIGRFVNESIRLADIQLTAEAQLLGALGEREDAQKRIIKQAQELQKITLFGDEQTIDAATKLAGLIGDNEDAIIQLLPLLQDFSEFFKVELSTAAVLFGKTIGSSTNALTRYGIAVEGAAGSQERINSLIENFSKTNIIGQAVRNAETGTGVFVQLKNTINDLREELGILILDRLRPLGQFLKDVLENLKPLRVAVSSAADDFKTLGGEVLKLFVPLKDLAVLLKLYDPDKTDSAGAKFINFLKGWLNLATTVPRAAAGLVNIVKDWRRELDILTNSLFGFNTVQKDFDEQIKTSTRNNQGFLDAISKGIQLFKESQAEQLANVKSIENLQTKVKELTDQLNSAPIYSQESIDLANQLKVATDELTKATEFYKNILEPTQKILDKYKNTLKEIELISFRLNEDDNERNRIVQQLVDDYSEYIGVIGEAEVVLQGLARTIPESFPDDNSEIFSFFERLGGELEGKKEQIKSLALTLRNSLVDIANAQLAAEIAQTDSAINQQQRRVDEALKIADQGNAELLESEKRRLEQLNKERAKQARTQIILNQALAISEGIVAVVSGFKSGPAAGIANAVALAATIATGLAAIRQASNEIGTFYEGEEYVKLRGKNRKGRDTIPAMVHEGERIVPAANNRKYMKDYNILQRGLVEPGVLAELYRSRYKMKDTRSEINDYLGGKIFVNMKGLESRLDMIEKAIKRQPSTSVSISKEGIYAAVSSVQSDIDKINRVK